MCKTRKCEKDTEATWHELNARYLLIYLPVIHAKPRPEVSVYLWWCDSILTHTHTYMHTHIIHRLENLCYSNQIKQPYPLLSFSPNQTLFVTVFLQLWEAPLEKLIIFQLRLKTLPSSLCVTQRSGLLALAGIRASLTGLKIFGCSGH